MTRFLVEIRGLVQGVGFRPFVAQAAAGLGLAGHVRNTSYGVFADVQGPEAACGELLRRIQTGAPPGTLLFSVSAQKAPPRDGQTGFLILPSDTGPPLAAVSPDLGICPDCLRELSDPADRRYCYPFLNCTHCGPRFTILARIPYDRANTTMAGFQLCPDCAREYGDPGDRRFHAQPNACPRCGPRLFWRTPVGETEGEPIAAFTNCVRQGGIAAVRGLGGYHLACDPRNADAVAMLRLRKHRDEKPLALMAENVTEAARICHIDPREAEELTSPRRPIVLLRRRKDCTLPDNLAPGSGRLGLMLPYTPLHVLLTRELPLLVMTSANRSDEPMPYTDEAADELWPLCDGVLTHNRPILRRADDSVCVFYSGGRQLLRRARGFAPLPVPICLPGVNGAAPPILAFGAQLKNTFCVFRDGLAYPSSHMGDLDDARAYESCEREIPSFLDLFGVSPALLAHDLHPDYGSTRAAEDFHRRYPAARRVAVPHHQAHFASVLGEHGLEQALGFVFDGAGRGEDGSIWGAEVFCGGIADARRVGTMLPLRLPGGDAAIREPWRAALCAVAEACGEEKALALFANHPETPALLRLAERGVAAPLSSGMGRLFDVFAVLAGLPHQISYEGQAAMALEQLFNPGAAGCYPLHLTRQGDLWVFDWREAVRSAITDRENGADAGMISARFHRGLIALVVQITAAYPELPVALSGGVFQNLRLLDGVTMALQRRGRRVYTNQTLPPNDACISYGQAVYAAARFSL